MSKKTESLELRLSPELKQTLISASKERDQSMSLFVRTLIETALSDPLTETERTPIMTRPFRTRLTTTTAAGALLLTLGVLTGTFSNQPAMAQSVARTTFAEFDRNGDGVVDKAEFDAVYSGLVEIDPDDLDLDEGELAIADLEGEIPEACLSEFGDGAFEGIEIVDDATLSAEEFAFYDQNADGRIVFGEVQSVIAEEMIASFAEIDGNGDGAVILAEYQAYMGGGEAMAADEDLGISQDCVIALGDMEGETDESFDALIRMEFAQLDRNRDDQISLMEYLDD